MDFTLDLYLVTLSENVSAKWKFMAIEIQIGLKLG